MAKHWMSVPEFLEEFDVPKSTFARWRATGKAPQMLKLPNGQLRISRTAVDAWIANNLEEAA